jgi:patatin-like phospholipase/acyl hydrolase
MFRSDTCRVNRKLPVTAHSDNRIKVKKTYHHLKHKKKSAKLQRKEETLASSKYLIKEWYNHQTEAAAVREEKHTTMSERSRKKHSQERWEVGWVGQRAQKKEEGYPHEF